MLISLRVSLHDKFSFKQPISSIDIRGKAERPTEQGLSKANRIQFTERQGSASTSWQKALRNIF